MRTKVFTGLTFCLILFIAGCSETVTTVEESPVRYGTTCELGCIEPDPSPNEPGVFLGSGVTPQLCINGIIPTLTKTT